MSYSGNQPVYGTFPSDLFTGNGSNTVFTMSSVPGNDAALLVTIDGVRQHTDTYSYSANTLTFSEAPGNGAIIETVNMGSRADVIITEGVYKKTQFTATAAQTNFTIPTGYTVGFVDVYLNGIRLVVADDYTATDGSTIILATPAANGDSVEVVAYGTFNVANALLKSGDTMSGNLVVSGTSTLMAPVAIANTTGNTFVVANTGAVTITGTANVSGAVALSNTFTVTGNATFSNNVSMTASTLLIDKGSSTTTIWSRDSSNSQFAIDHQSSNTVSIQTNHGSGWLDTIKLNPGGRVTIPNQPRFLATISGSTQTGIYTANGSYIQIRFNSATFNVGSCFNTSTYTFTAPVTGYYQFYISTYFYSWTVGSYEPYSLYFYKNGSVAARFAVGAQPSSGANPTTNSNQVTLYLTAGDYVSAYVNVAAGSGTAILYYESTFFGGYLLG